MFMWVLSQFWLIILLIMGYIFLWMSGNFWLDASHCVFTFFRCEIFCFPIVILELWSGMPLNYLKIVWALQINLLIYEADVVSVWSGSKYFPLLRHNLLEYSAQCPEKSDIFPANCGNRPCSWPFEGVRCFYLILSDCFSLWPMPCSMFTCV